MSGNDCGTLSQNDRNLVRDKLAAIEHAKFNKSAGCAVVTFAEIVLAAGIELDVGGQHVAILVQEADKTTVVIEMTMAHDHRIDLAGIGASQFDIVDQSLRRIAEIEHDGALLVGAL